LKDREQPRDGTITDRGSGSATTQSKDAIGEMPSTWGSVYQGAFDPKGRFLVTASQDGVVRIWTLDQGTLKDWPKRHLSILLRGHRSMVLSVDVAEDGTIASGSGDLTVRFWQRFSPLSPQSSGGGRPVQFSDAKPSFVDSRNVIVMQPGGNWSNVQLPTDFGEAAAAAISADGRTIVVAPVQGRPPVLFATGYPDAPLRRLTGPTREWAGVAFLEGDKKVAAITKTGITYTWPLFSNMGEVTELAKKNLPFLNSTGNRLEPQLPCQLRRINKENIVEECD
jgi:WD40 repeat protein